MAFFSLQLWTPSIILLLCSSNFVNYVCSYFWVRWVITILRIGNYCYLFKSSNWLTTADLSLNPPSKLVSCIHRQANGKKTAKLWSFSLNFKQQKMQSSPLFSSKFCVSISSYPSHQVIIRQYKIVIWLDHMYCIVLFVSFLNVTCNLRILRNSFWKIYLCTLF